MKGILAFFKKPNRCDLYLASWSLYYLQGTLYPESSSLSRILFLMNMLVAIYYVIYVNLHYKKKPFLKGLNILLVLFTIYGIILYVTRGTSFIVHGEILDSNLYLKAIYLSLFPVYPFYYFSLKGYLTSDKIRGWTMVFFIVTTCSFFYEQKKRIMQLAELGFDTDNVTNNTSYMFLSLIPFLVLYRKKILFQYFGLAYCLYYIMIGMKRGAILIAVICLMFFLYDNFKNSSYRKKFALFLLTGCLMVLGGMFISDTMMQNDYFQTRLTSTLEGNSSGRDEIYSHIWMVFENSNMFHFLFGYGAQGSFIMTAKFAHSDWLELLINQGLLGFIIYINYWKNYYISWRSAKNIEVKNILGLLLLIFLFKSIFSMSYASYTYYTNCLLGYCLANLYYNKKECV